MRLLRRCAEQESFEAADNFVTVIIPGDNNRWMKYAYTCQRFVKFVTEAIQFPRMKIPIASENNRLEWDISALEKHCDHGLCAD
ncbi:MAG: hypothetical protein VR65_27550 [Desulfobulbaceae bacterium BRH_c16a]|nr:MAG: hypothetical protein VR65_27550 [Desulfobulbaceae bacterium BRH_c16a]